jgi:hypothetical protein
MVSDLANRVYFRYWGEIYLKDVREIKKASIMCLDLIKSDRIHNMEDYDDVDDAIVEIMGLYLPKN